VIVKKFDKPLKTFFDFQASFLYNNYGYILQIQNRNLNNSNLPNGTSSNTFSEAKPFIQKNYYQNQQFAEAILEFLINIPTEQPLKQQPLL